MKLKKLGRLLRYFEDQEFDLRVESLFEGYKNISEPQTQAFLSESMERLKLVKHSRKDTWFLGLEHYSRTHIPDKSTFK